MAIALRTPPTDNTGLPHILEHTVLCGSKKFPVKDPFVELLKTSLATFLNAMTYSDKTVYPCASMVEKDFYNLAEVYCDAVFHPLIKEEHFKQEGHHFNFATPGDTSTDLLIKGIVYNEMKGAYSDLDGTIHRHCSTSICPDNAYGYDSGGDPDFIPDLTYEAFTEFHRTHYHPSNARILFYGCLPPTTHMEFLDRICLSDFDRIEVDSTIGTQARWSEPRAKTLPYPVDASTTDTAKSAVALTFLTNPIGDVQTTMAMKLLEAILLDNSSSPLRKALIDSKLGEELTSSGYDAYQRDTAFLVGLKGTEADRAEAIRDLVLSTCRSLCEGGLGQERVERSLHQFELASRSIPSHYPLHLMDEVYTSWLYDGDPCLNLRLSDQLDALKEQLKEDPRFLESVLLEQIVENPHHTLLTFVPDASLNETKQSSFEERMKEARKQFSDNELSRLAHEAVQLEDSQGQPNSPQALSTLPRLSRGDIPGEAPDFDTEERKAGGHPLLYSNVFANGLSYVNLSYDLSGIEEELLPYLPLFTDAVQKMGTQAEDYVRMAEREEACCGGIGVSVGCGGLVQDPKATQLSLGFNFKALDGMLNEACGVLRDRFLHCSFTDRERLTDIILQGRMAWQSRIIRGGSGFARLYAARSLSGNSALSNQLSGIPQLRLFEQLAAEVKESPDRIIELLNRVQKALQASSGMVTSYVGAESNLACLNEALLPVQPASAGLDGFGTFDSRPECVDQAAEGLYTASDVAFAAQAWQTVGLSHPDASALLLLGSQLSFSYLWEEIRVKGGAYGGHGGYDPLNGVFSLSSYRDPNVAPTLTVFQGTADYILSRMDLSGAGVEQAIIGTLKSLDRPIRPGEACGAAAGRWLRGNDKAFRRVFRKRLLSLTGDDIKRVAVEQIQAALPSAPSCVIGSKAALEEANQLPIPTPLHLEPMTAG
jgi:Zn-dependent M16 (insulinase) family peptidase